MTALAPDRAALLIGVFASQYGGNRAVCEDLADKLEEKGWGIVRASGRRTALARFIETLRVVLLEPSRYDVANIDVFSGRAFIWAICACEALRVVGKPYGVTLHGGGLPRFSRRFGAPLKRMLSGAAYVVTPSPYLQNEFALWGRDIELIPNALSLDAYPHRQRGPLRPELVWVRAFHEIYRPWLVPAIVARVAERVPSVRVRMIGPDKGDGSLDRTVREIARLGVQQLVSVEGAVDKADIPRILSGADVFLNTSAVDNAPVTVSEAMACGLCVVSSRVGGLPDLVEHGVNGLLVAAGADEFAEAIVRLLLEPALAGQISRAARAKVKSQDWPSVLPRWERVLTSARGPDRRCLMPAIGSDSEPHSTWNLRLADVPAIVRVHCNSFPESKLTLLGRRAVAAYYEWLLTGPHDCLAIGVGERAELRGFLMGGYFRGAASGFVKRKWPLLAMCALRRPTILWDREVVVRGSGIARILLYRAAPAPSSVPATWGVLSMAVDPSARGRGYGAKLLRLAEERAFAAGAALMQLTVRPDNVAAATLYEKQGWRREPPPPAWNGRMVKRLR